ncbi:unnamed protein product [Medioppia subpectinata]|uniref:RRM domain-containing protein n=1 Tax=Medioppia subpectinata TaxID=1979941 RepID=A0A7R9L4C0_9ACAR|nr:unnamed protein product [Medioppia subpectinata]CAG2114067.1 unnamed protein product [Medioppia subpectinata]
MNANPYQMRPSGPTGSVHNRSANSGGQPSAADEKKWGDTTSRAGEVSRVFIGGVDYKSTSCAEIEQRFRPYGNILGIDIHPKNFAFVQFERVEDAENACRGENATSLKNKKIEVRVFDKSGHPTKGRAAPNRDRSRSPTRGSMGGGGGGGPTGTRHGAPVPHMNQYDDPYGYNQGPPPPQQPPPTDGATGNECEIIVVSKEQWGYADMIEKRLKQETGLRYVDMLFLHTPGSLSLTLNDLFERQTLYALVVAPVNEEHVSVTLHVLHNQTEHRNMPLEDALRLITNDFQAYNGMGGGGEDIRAGPPAAYPMGGNNASSAPNDQSYRSAGNALPQEVSYLLRQVLEENGTQYLSPTQLDSLIDYFQRQKSRMAEPKPVVDKKPAPIDLEKQKATLLDNPHVQAALSSLLQIGALTGDSPKPSASANPFSALTSSFSGSNSAFGGSNTGANPLFGGSTTAYGGQQQNNGSANAPTRRHPLFGTEVKPQSIPGAPGGLVGYPPVQSYNQYQSYQY